MNIEEIFVAMCNVAQIDAAGDYIVLEKDIHKLHLSKQELHELKKWAI